MSFQSLKKELIYCWDIDKAKIYKKFFQTWKWQYWEWDKFLWVTVPVQRKIAKKYQHINFELIKKLLEDELHECRFTSLIILTLKYKDALKNWKEDDMKEIFEFYLSMSHRINNWDLVDCSCYQIVWDYLIDKNREILYRLAESELLWERRISIVSTYAFIRLSDLDDTFKLSEILLKDEHPLIHKAVWWMLREWWKRNRIKLENFLDEYATEMSRTTLRYALEKFDQKTRFYYLNQK